MTIDYRNGISILELIVYFPGFFLALLVAFRHGFGRNLGWYFLVSFTTVRIVGACSQLATITDHSTGVETTAIICSSIGLSPLILACVGLLSRVNDSTKNPLPSNIFRFIHLFTILALILGIIGGTSSTSMPSGSGVPIVDIKTKVAVLLILLAWLALCILVLVIFTIGQTSSTDPGETRLLLAVAVSVPFIFVRLVYSLLVDFAKSKLFNPITGSVTAELCMAIIEEFIVVVVLLAAGITVRDVAKPKAPPRPLLVGSNRSSNSNPHSHSYIGKTERHGAVDVEMGNSRRQQQERNPPQLEIPQYAEQKPRQDKPRRERRQRPIRGLIGMAVDYHQSR